MLGSSRGRSDRKDQQAMTDAVAKHHDSAEKRTLQWNHAYDEQQSRSCAGKGNEPEHEAEQSGPEESCILGQLILRNGELICEKCP